MNLTGFHVEPHMCYACNTCNCDCDECHQRLSRTCICPDCPCSLDDEDAAYSPCNDCHDGCA